MEVPMSALLGIIIVMEETKIDSSFHSGDITDHIFLQLIG